MSCQTKSLWIGNLLGAFLVGPAISMDLNGYNLALNQQLKGKQADVYKSLFTTEMIAI